MSCPAIVHFKTAGLACPPARSSAFARLCRQPGGSRPHSYCQVTRLTPELVSKAVRESVVREIEKVLEREVERA